MANYVMYNTFLIPNDYDIFIKNFNSNNKYVLKNSFGGARSTLKITNSLKEIQYYYSINKKNNFDPSLCKDAVCHSKVKYNIVQEFMEPGLLINNKKVEFRLYLVIFSIIVMYRHIFIKMEYVIILRMIIIKIK